MKLFRHCFLFFSYCLIAAIFCIPKVWACGGGFGSYDYSSYNYKLIDPEIITPYSYKSFLESVADRYSNHEEWQEVNDAHLHVENIDSLLNEVPLQVLEEKLNTSNDPTTSAIYQYIIFTRDVAPFVTPKSQPYYYYSDTSNSDYEQKRRQTLLDLSLVRAEDIGVTSPFLNFRYNFQALRLASMLNQYELVEKIYHQKIAPNKSDSIVRYWAQGYYARAQLKLERPVDALLTYATIYDQCPPMMDTAIGSLRYIGRNNFIPAIERLKKSKHRQATLRLLETLTLNRDYSAEPLKMIIELEPKADRAEFLLSRIFTTLNDFNSIGDIRNLVKQDFSLQRYRELVEICRERGDYWRVANQPDRGGLWSIIGSYLALLDGNNDMATSLLAKVESVLLSDEAIKLALRQVHSLAAIANASTGTSPLSETELTAISMLLRDIKDVEAVNSWRLLLAEYFNQQNDLVRSLACLKFVPSDGKIPFENVIESGFVDGALNMLGDNEWQQLENLVAGKDLSPFDQYLHDTLPNFSRQSVIYRRAEIYQAADMHKKAIEQFNRLGEHFWNIKQYKVSESSPLLKKEPDIKTMNAYQYSLYMVELQKELSQVPNMSPEEAQKLYFHLGNIEYYQFATNVPGHGRLLTERRIKRSFGWLHIYENRLNPAVIVRIYEANNWQNAPTLVCEKSLEYFNKAIEIDADPEITAQSLIMASASKNVFLHVKLNPDDPTLTEDLKYHRKLAADYQNTQFYQEYLKECPLLKMFD